MGHKTGYEKAQNKNGCDGYLAKLVAEEVRYFADVLIAELGKED